MLMSHLIKIILIKCTYILLLFNFLYYFMYNNYKKYKAY